MAKPKFDLMWAGFPTRVEYGNMKALFEHLGGAAERNINAPGFGVDGNTCAARLSVALHAGGVAISGGPGIRTLGTASGKRIIYGVADMRTFLERELGRPERDVTVPFHSDFLKRKGIISFSVSGWTDATGHIALFDKGTYRDTGDDRYFAMTAASTGGPRTVVGEFWEIA
jgi:hypothetical protein